MYKYMYIPMGLLNSSGEKVNFFFYADFAGSMMWGGYWEGGTSRYVRPPSYLFNRSNGRPSISLNNNNNNNPYILGLASSLLQAYSFCKLFLILFLFFFLIATGSYRPRQRMFRNSSMNTTTPPPPPRNGSSFSWCFWGNLCPIHRM